MPFNGSGIFSRIYSWTNDAAAAIKIRADRMDNEMTGFATGLTNCVTRDGQSPATANLPMGGFKHTNVALATASTEYATFGQLLGRSAIYCTVGGTNNAITLSSGVSIAAYTAGMVVTFIVGSTNSGAVTVNLDGLGAKDLTKRGATALASSDIQTGWVISAVYDGTQFQVITMRTIGGADIGNNAVTTTKILDANVTTAKIADDNVTYAKIQNVSAQYRLLGRSSSGAGDVEEITTSAVGLALLDDTTLAAQQATLGIAVIDRAYAEVATTTVGTTLLPADNTIPQITEGTQILSVSITPKSATNRLRIRVQGQFNVNSGSNIIGVALFNGATNAIAARGRYVGTADSYPISLEHEYVAGTTSPVTFTVRVGPNSSATVQMNGYYSTASITSIVVEEIRV